MSTTFIYIVWGSSSHSRIFHSYEDVTITCERLQILIYARHSWPLSSEFLSVPNLLWHGWPMTLTPIAERCSGAVTTCFNDLGLYRLLFEHPNFRLRGERSNPLCHRRNYIFIYNMTRFWNVNPYAFSQACLYTVFRWNILGNVCPT